jgi:hypothetical protein
MRRVVRGATALSRLTPPRHSGSHHDMKCIPLAALLAFMMVTPTFARLGETLEECVQRYGPVIEKRAPVLTESDPEALVFTKSAITITVEFRQGKAWHVSFRKTPMSITEVEAILLANSANALWGLPLKTRDKDYRMSDDQSRLAVVNWDRKGLAGSLVVMSREFAQANRAQTVKRAQSGEGSGAAKAAGNPLPGF